MQWYSIAYNKYICTGMLFTEIKWSQRIKAINIRVLGKFVRDSYFILSSSIITVLSRSLVVFAGNGKDESLGGILIVYAENRKLHSVRQSEIAIESILHFLFKKQPFNDVSH